MHQHQLIAFFAPIIHLHPVAFILQTVTVTLTATANIRPSISAVWLNGAQVSVDELNPYR